MGCCGCKFSNDDAVVGLVYKTPTRKFLEDVISCTIPAQTKLPAVSVESSTKQFQTLVSQIWFLIANCQREPNLDITKNLELLPYKMEENARKLVEIAHFTAQGKFQDKLALALVLLLAQCCHKHPAMAIDLLNYVEAEVAQHHPFLKTCLDDLVISYSISRPNSTR